MGLDTILELGKKDLAVRALEEEFNKDQSIPAVLSLAEIAGDKLPGRQEDYLAVTPAENRLAIDTDKRAYQEGLINAVTENPDEAVSGFRKEDDIVSYLLSQKPIKGAGSDEIRNAHERAYDAGNELQDPRKIDEAFNKYLGSFKSVGTALVTGFLAKREPGLKQNLVIGAYQEAIGELKELLGEDGRNYVLSMYNSAEGNAKKEVAYSIGRAVTEISLAGEREN